MMEVLDEQEKSTGVFLGIEMKLSIENPPNKVEVLKKESTEIETKKYSSSVDKHSKTPVPSSIVSMNFPSCQITSYKYINIGRWAFRRRRFESAIQRRTDQIGPIATNEKWQKKTSSETKKR